MARFWGSYMDVLWGFWLLDLTVTAGWWLIWYVGGARVYSPDSRPARLGLLGASLALALIVRVAVLAGLLSHPASVPGFLVRDFVVALPCAAVAVGVAGLLARGAMWLIGRERPRGGILSTRAELLGVLCLLVAAMVLSGAELAVHGLEWRVSGGPMARRKVAAAQNRLAHVWRACVQYGRKHEGRWPERLSELLNHGYLTELGNPRFPDDPDPWRYVPPPKGSSSGTGSHDIVVLYEQPPGPVEQVGRLVCFLDSRIVHITDRAGLASVLDRSQRLRRRLEDSDQARE